jgi:hypothetical protein
MSPNLYRHLMLVKRAGMLAKRARRLEKGLGCASVEPPHSLTPPSADEMGSSTHCPASGVTETRMIPAVGACRRRPQSQQLR